MFVMIPEMSNIFHILLSSEQDSVRLGTDYHYGITQLVHKLY